MTTDLDSLCSQLDAIRNELRQLARQQRRNSTNDADRDTAKECDHQADKLTEVADHITTFIAPYLK